MPGIFVDPNETFPVRVHYRPKTDDSGTEVGVELWDPKELPEEPGWKILTGFFRQVDEDSFGRILEQATIINHVNHRPTLMTRSLRQQVLATYMVDWDLGEDGEGGHPEGERVPITPGWFKGAKFKIANRLFVEFMDEADLADVVRVAANNEETLSHGPGLLDPAVIGGPRSMRPPDAFGDATAPMPPRPSELNDLKMKPPPPREKE